MCKLQFRVNNFTRNLTLLSDSEGCEIEVATTPGVWHPEDGGSGDDDHTRRGHYVTGPWTPERIRTKEQATQQVTVSFGDISPMYLQTVFHKG